MTSPSPQSWIQDDMNKERGFTLRSPERTLHDTQNRDKTSDP